MLGQLARRWRWRERQRERETEGEREREIDRYREIAVFTCPDSRLEP